MLRVPSKKGEPKRRVKFVGICADAEKLGVSREHLYRVLIGQRTSQSLLKRYRELKGKGDKAPGTTGQSKSSDTTSTDPDPSALIGAPHTGSYTAEFSP
jgi:hypothetical protein